MRNLWLIFWSQRVATTVAILETQALLLLTFGFVLLSGLYAVTGVAIALCFGSASERGSSDPDWQDFSGSANGGRKRPARSSR